MPNSNKTNQPQNTQIPKPPLSPTPIVPLQIEPEPIFVMTIELEQGKVGHIKIYPDSIAEELSYDFCHQNNLDFQSLNYLKEQIQELIDDYNKKHNINKEQKEIQEQEKEKKEEKPKLTSYDSILESFRKKKREKSKCKSSLSKNYKPNLIQKVKQSSESRKESNKSCNYSTQRNLTTTQNEGGDKKFPVANSKNQLFIPSSHFNTKRTESNDSKRHRSQSKKNYGEILYERSKIEQKQKITKINEMKTQLRLQTEQNFTFKPTFYRSSPNLIFKPSKNYNCKTQVTQENTEYLLTNANPPSQKNNGFSEKILNKQDSSKFLKIRAKTPLQPKNRPPSQKKIRHQHYLTENNKIPFSSRQMNYKKKAEDNIKKIRDELYPPTDLTTGQPLFRPKLISNQHRNSKLNNNTGNIFYNLYSYADKYRYNQLNRNKEFKNEINNMSNKSKLSVNTEEIFQKKKIEVFKYLFKLLDHDEDNMISIYTIELKKIPDNILNIINPIINDLREYQGSISQNEFIDECQSLFDVSLSFFLLF